MKKRKERKKKLWLPRGDLIPPNQVHKSKKEYDRKYDKNKWRDRKFDE